MDDNKRKLENESESDGDCIGPLPAEAVPTKKTKSIFLKSLFCNCFVI